MLYKEIEKFFSSLTDLKKSKTSFFEKYQDFFSIKKLIYKPLIQPLENRTFLIHIAGTNGKGSTGKMLSNLLYHKGYRVGLFSSPHIIRYNERIIYQNNEISDPELLFFIQEYKDSFLKDPLFEGKFFLATFILSLIFFQKKPLDFLILETGLGGRLDYTNFFKKKLCILQSIHLDHREYLGKTISKIAKEKGGIIHKKNPVFVSMQSYSYTYSIFKKIAKLKKSFFKYYGKDFYIDSIQVLDQKKIFWLKIGNNICQIETGLETPKIQIFNLLLVLNVLKYYSIEIDYPYFLDMKLLDISGRFEIIRKNPTFIIDVAHNLQSIRMTLYNILNLPIKFEKYFLILGISNRICKDYSSILPEIIPYFNPIFIIELDFLKNKQNTLSIFKWLEKEYPKKEIYFANNFKTAFESFKDKISDKDLLLMTGSFYLIGEVKTYFHFFH